MLKVTIKFTVYCAIFWVCGCDTPETGSSEQEKQHYSDSVSELRIDSAYREIKMACDTMMVYQVPKMVDSLLKDTSLLQTFFDSNNIYIDADKKVEKVIRLLKADCDSSLLKETYRRARLQQKLKPKRHTKAKV